LIDDKKTGERFRPDKLIEDYFNSKSWKKKIEIFAKEQSDIQKEISNASNILEPIALD
jgi:glycyl-tRNA synthetase (class II)